MSNWVEDKSRLKQFKERTGVYDSCTCSAYPFPHRKKSSVWCKFSTKEPTEEDYRILHGIPP